MFIEIDTATLLRMILKRTLIPTYFVVSNCFRVMAFKDVWLKSLHDWL